jgi:hypothetical protein
MIGHIRSVTAVTSRRDGNPQLTPSLPAAFAPKNSSFRVICRTEAIFNSPKRLASLYKLLKTHPLSLLRLRTFWPKACPYKNCYLRLRSSSWNQR